MKTRFVFYWDYRDTQTIKGFFEREINSIEKALENPIGMGSEIEGYLYNWVSLYKDVLSNIKQQEMET